MRKTAKCRKKPKCGKCYSNCSTKFNPKNKDRLNYYVSQNLWECKTKCIDKFFPRKKRSTNKKKYKRNINTKYKQKCRNNSCFKKK
jgi:hypothetical protein